MHVFENTSLRNICSIACPPAEFQQAGEIRLTIFLLAVKKAVFRLKLVLINKKNM